LQAYEQYTARFGLPLWRIEMGLAQIAMLIDAQRRPGVELALRDYLIRPEQHTPQAPPPDAPAEVTEAEAAATAEALGFKPRKKKSKPAQPETPAP
jgi:hypothetical protein